MTEFLAFARDTVSRNLPLIVVSSVVMAAWLLFPLVINRRKLNVSKEIAESAIAFIICIAGLVATLVLMAWAAIHNPPLNTFLNAALIAARELCTFCSRHTSTLLNWS